MHNNNRYSIFVDLDNTIIDTALRKQKILKDRFEIGSSIEEIIPSKETRSLLL